VKLRHLSLLRKPKPISKRLALVSVQESSRKPKTLFSKVGSSSPVVSLIPNASPEPDASPEVFLFPDALPEEVLLPSPKSEVVRRCPGEAGGSLALLPRPEVSPVTTELLPGKCSAPKPLKLHFYNRKHKVKRASKMDMGQFAGDLISIAPGAVPLVGDQSSVSGGSSGLFSAFESSGFTGSKEVVLRAPVALGAPADEAGKSLVHSSPAKGMLRRGFLMPRPCGGVSRRSPEPGQSSAVGFTSEAGQSSGISSERCKVLREAFELPWNISEDGVEVEDGVLEANGYPEAVADALAIAPLLGISCGENEKGFLDLLSDIEEGHKREGVFADEGGSVLKSKGWRERKNLECSLNFDVGSIGSGRVKNRSCLRV
jgi:hypothetical protein